MAPMKDTVAPQNARTATLDVLIRQTLPHFLNPIPHRDTLRAWFKHLPKFKANPAAKRGGGNVFYSVAAVEKFLQGRTR
jgi:hypothetical protein